MLQCNPFRINRPDDYLTSYRIACAREKKIVVLHEHRHVLFLTGMRSDSKKSQIPELIQLRGSRQLFLFSRRRQLQIR